jgi:hypothetical protein
MKKDNKPSREGVPNAQTFNAAAINTDVQYIVAKNINISNMATRLADAMEAVLSKDITEEKTISIDGEEMALVDIRPEQTIFSDDEFRELMCDFASKHGHNISWTDSDTFVMEGTQHVLAQMEKEYGALFLLLLVEAEAVLGIYNEVLERIIDTMDNEESEEISLHPYSGPQYDA